MSKKAWLSALTLSAILWAILLAAGSALAWDLTWGWTPGVTAAPLDGFRILRKKATETAYTQLATTGDTVRSFSDPDRTVGNCYGLEAYNTFGASSRITACANGPDGTITFVVLK